MQVAMAQEFPSRTEGSEPLPGDTWESSIFDGKLGAKRAKRGECLTCGAKLFKISILGKKTPISIDGQVLNGKCLSCKPNRGGDNEMANNPLGLVVGDYQYEPPDPPVHKSKGNKRDPHIPRVLKFHRESGSDDSTTVSDITLDRHLRGKQNDHSETSGADEDDIFHSRHTRGVNDGDSAPTLPSRSRDNGSFGRNPRPLSPSEGHRDTCIRRPDRTISHSDQAPIVSTKTSPEDSQASQQRRKTSVRSPWEGAPLPISAPPAMIRNSPNSRKNTVHSIPDWKDRPQNFSTAPDHDLDPDLMVEPRRHMHRREDQQYDLNKHREIVFDSTKKTSHSNASRAQFVPGEIVIDPCESDPASHHQLHFTSPEEAKFKVAEISLVPSQPSSDDYIPVHPDFGPSKSSPSARLSSSDYDLAVELSNLSVLIKSLADKSLPAYHTIMEKLAATFHVHGNEARSLFVECGGLEAWVSAIWQVMDDEKTQLAAIEMMFALASSDEDCNYEWLAHAYMDQVIDALLITMTMLDNEAIQSAACRVLVALACASGKNSDVRDGTLSGALEMVLKTLEKYRRSDSPLVLEWSMRALFVQCSLSTNSQNNKVTLVRAVLDDGKNGPEVLSATLELALNNLYLATWVCSLYRSISCNPHLVSTFPTFDIDMKTMMSLVRKFGKDPAACAMIEAVFGTFNNGCMPENMIQIPERADLLGFALDAARFHKSAPGLRVEAYSLVANIVPSIPVKDYFAEGAVDIANRLVKDSAANLEVNLEGLRAIILLVHNAKEVQTYFWKNVKIASVIEISRLHVDYEPWQELAFTFFACLLEETPCIEDEAGKRIFSEIGLAVSRYSDSVVIQEAASALVCQLSSSTNLSALLMDGLLCHTISAMTNFQHSSKVQMNGCTAIWRVAADGTLFEHSSLTDRCAACLVATLQSNLEQSSIVEVACGAIWAFIYNSDERRQLIAKAGGVDAVTCALVMHQGEVTILEKASGVLSSLSTSRALVPGILYAQGVSSVIDAIRNNTDSELLVEHGCLFLKNVIIVDKTQASVTTDVIPVIVTIMQKHLSNNNLQREACGFLWTVSSSCSECKSMVLALDAVTILMAALSSDDKSVQVAARGAFNEIALSANVGKAQ